MGRKGGWFSAIKRVFVSHSKEKLNHELDKNVGKERKKKGQGKYQHGETNSFIPLFREPSSIEKILGEAERDHKLIFRHQTPPEQQRTPPFVPPRVASPRVRSQRIDSPKAASQRIASPPRASSHRGPASPLPPPPGRAASPRAVPPRIVRPRPEPTLRNHHASATKIQAAFRGYMARRNFRALKGLVRLQGVVRGHNVKRQTITAMKYMQLLVRVQSQIQWRRIQMLENQAWHQAQLKNNKEDESAYGKWTLNQVSESGNEYWDDSVLSKEEIEARMQRKVEAVIKRERAMAYAYSHQLWKDTEKSPYMGLSDIRSGRFPWWWNWLERKVSPADALENQGMKTFQLTPSRPESSSKQQVQQFTFDNIIDIPTPRSTRSTILPATRPMQTPPPPSRLTLTPQATSSGLSNSKHSRQKGSIRVDSPMNFPAKDDDSLTSCPPFSVPNYMATTVSAKAKVRANGNPKERFMGTPGSESKRRLSFPLTQGIGSFKWGKGSLFSGKDSRSQRVLDKHQSLQSLGNMSVDSTVSMPATVGRKPFNRFV